MKTKLLVPLLGLLLFTGCSEDEVPEVQPEPEPQNFCYLQQLSTTTADGKSDSTVSFTYNDQNQVTCTEHYVKDKLVAARTYAYNTDGKLQVEHLMQPNGEEVEYTVFSYSTKGQLSKYEVKRNVFGIVHNTAAFKAAYDQQGRLTTATDYYYLNNKQQTNSTLSQTYTQGKPVVATLKGREGQTLYRATFVQDSSRTPLSAVPVFLNKRPGMGYPNLRNITSLRVTAGTDTVVARNLSYTGSYLKNVQGYPTETTLKYLDGRQVKVTYTYSCD